MNGLKLVEQKGVVQFLEDKGGRLFQKLGCLEPYRVKDGKITYKHIMYVAGFEIKYNNNGVYGFSVWRGKTNLEDNIWTTDDAERIAREMSKK